MLRISIVESGTRHQLVLEGKLVPPWTDELKNVCQRNQSDSEHRELVIDVRGLTVLSQEGEELLLALILQGARFRGSDVFTKQILKQLARRAQQLGNGNKKPQG
jgi:anti-anti-sigma regulatory factor